MIEGKTIEIDRAFADALREVVQRSSQQQVAAAAGVSQATICRLVNGSRVGSIRTALRLMAAYPELKGVFLPSDMPEQVCLE